MQPQAIPVAGCMVVWSGHSSLCSIKGSVKEAFHAHWTFITKYHFVANLQVPSVDVFWPILVISFIKQQRSVTISLLNVFQAVHIAVWSSFHFPYSQMVHSGNKYEKAILLLDRILLWGWPTDHCIRFGLDNPFLKESQFSWPTHYHVLQKKQGSV